MAVLTVYPDAHPESTSVDGNAARFVGGGEAWATIRSSAGTEKNDFATVHATQLRCDGNTDKYDFHSRLILLFDTSSLGAGATIDAATFEIVVDSKTDDFTDSISLVTSTPASNTAIENADYGQLGTTKQAADVTVASITADDATYNAWTLNATGEGNISLTSITKFGMRCTIDNDDTEPTWSAGDQTFVQSRTADHTGDLAPKLVIVYTPGVGATPLVNSPILMSKLQGLTS